MATAVKTRDIGQHYEKLAGRYLKRNGYQLVQRNFHSRYGEIDLIMRNHQFIVFVEVRYRSQPDQVHPLETITPRKQKAIQQTAQSFLQRSEWSVLQPRFDVIGITPSRRLISLNPVHVDWIKNAF